MFNIHQAINNLSQEWQDILIDFPQEILNKIEKNILQDIDNNIQIFPYDFFYALKCTKPQDINLVILGQDPYHNIINNIPQAHGLAFSVPHGIPIPPSLKNIDIELNKSLNINYPNHGCLELWAKQGILLLNSILSVQAHNAASHAKIGWKEFTDYLIQELSKKYNNIVWMLWGKYAQSKVKYIDNKFNKHLILCTSHPSPLSVYRGFAGCGHFKQAKDYIKEHKNINLDFIR